MPETKNSAEWIYFVRQLMVCSGAWCCFFIFGLCVGSPTVIIPQIRKEANSTEAVSPEMAAWLPATLIYSGIPWVFILPMLTTYFGRKITYVVVCVTSFIGFIICYTSNTNVQQILISEIFQGPIAASYFTVAIMILTEFTSSKYRGLFLTIKGASFFWGILASNLIGTFFNWRNIALFGLLCSIYKLLTVVLWPESPYWLASQGRFDQCSKSHRWLKGSDTDSEKELENLIAENRRMKRKVGSLKSQTVHNLKNTIKREFYVPVLLSALLMALYMFSGKLICTVYALVIIKKITNSESTAYNGMLILDGITVLCMYLGCFLSKKIKRRTLLLTASSLGIFFLLSLSLYLYLIKLLIINENKYASIALLICYSVTISCGPMILSTSISGELIPLESRSFSFCIISLVFKLMNGTFMKLCPYGFQFFGLHGTFLFFALSSSFCLVLIYFYLPETKDKTLQEISNGFKGIKHSDEAKEFLPISNKIIIVPRDLN